MGLGFYLQQPFAQNALIAGALIALISGLIGPFVITRRMAFAVHGAAELSFTGAAAGLVIADDAVAGALIGSLVVAAAFGILAARDRERDAGIGVVLAFGLGAGVFLLSQYHGFASAATNILFGNIYGVSHGRLELLLGVAVGVLIAMTLLYRPLLFASVDPDVAEARGVRTRLVGILFLFILSLTVTLAAQVVGTTLVLSLAITPAAAAQRLTARPFVATLLSICFALVAADGGLLVNLETNVSRASVYVTAFSFVIYVVARVVGTRLRGGSRGRRGAHAGGVTATSGEAPIPGPGAQPLSGIVR